MGETKCYAMVRGSAIRVTELGRSGAVLSPVRYATSKTLARIQINESTESSSNELLASEDEDDTPRLHFIKPDQTIRYTVDIDFLRVDPGVFNLVAGTPLVSNDDTDVAGFDSDTRTAPTSFALEVWSKLAGTDCITGERQWGYTLFPFLKGGYLSGFEFSNGLVSFNLRNAQARRVSRWGVGPYDLTGTYERLLEPVSRNVMFKSFITTAVPPTEADGIQETTDAIDGGTATVTTADIIDGEFVDTSIWVVEGGSAV